MTRFADRVIPTGICDSDRSAWLAARRQYVTASSVAAILGLDQARGALDVYAEHVAPPSPEGDSVDLFDRRVWGKALERSVLETAAKAYGWQVGGGGELLVSRQHGWLGATLDAEILSAGCSQWLVYEGKCVDLYRARDWDEEHGLPPDRVLCQAQTQLLVTGAPVCVVFALIGGNRPCRIDVTPDAELQQLIVEATHEFWDRIQTLSPPPADWRSRDALKRLYPQESGESIELSAEAAEWTAELQELSAKRLACERREDELKNLLRATLGHASYGLLPCEVAGKSVWKCVTEERKSYTVAASSSRALRLVKSLPKAATMRRPPELCEPSPVCDLSAQLMASSEADNKEASVGNR